ncbi:MAG TPA: alpha/beta hydrolase [Xanthobacteraceae bacterium]|nr:alpha/beta hydrolase [Xanthobacteraceae bacterium]
MADATEHYETIAGCKTQYMRGGKGPTLLFLHGGGGAGIWFPFFQMLSEKYDVVMPEHPGFGRTDTPEWLDNVGDIANFYFEFIKKLGLKDIHLVGNSLGGWISSDIAVRNSTPFKSLTLITSAGIHVPGVAPGDLFLWNPEQLLRNLFHDQAFPEMVLKMPVDEEERKRQAKNSLTLAKVGWQPRLYDPNLQKWLHRIDIPTLIIWGDHDKIMPPPYGPAFQKLIPNSKLEVMKNCGHVPQLERPEETVGLIVKHISGVK